MSVKFSIASWFQRTLFSELNIYYILASVKNQKYSKLKKQEKEQKSIGTWITTECYP